MSINKNSKKSDKSNSWYIVKQVNKRDEVEESETEGFETDEESETQYDPDDPQEQLKRYVSFLQSHLVACIGVQYTQSFDAKSDINRSKCDKDNLKNINAIEPNSKEKQIVLKKKPFGNTVTKSSFSETEDDGRKLNKQIDEVKPSTNLPSKSEREDKIVKEKQLTETESLSVKSGKDAGKKNKNKKSLQEESAIGKKIQQQTDKRKPSPSEGKDKNIKQKQPKTQGISSKSEKDGNQIDEENTLKKQTTPKKNLPSENNAVKRRTDEAKLLNSLSKPKGEKEHKKIKRKQPTTQDDLTKCEKGANTISKQNDLKNEANINITIANKASTSETHAVIKKLNLQTQENQSISEGALLKSERHSRTADKQITLEKNTTKINEASSSKKSVVRKKLNLETKEKQSISQRASLEIVKCASTADKDDTLKKDTNINTTMANQASRSETSADRNKLNSQTQEMQSTSQDASPEKGAITADKHIVLENDTNTNTTMANKFSSLEISVTRKKIDSSTRKVKQLTNSLKTSKKENEAVEEKQMTAQTILSKSRKSTETADKQNTLKKKTKCNTTRTNEMPNAKKDVIQEKINSQTDNVNVSTSKRDNEKNEAENKSLSDTEFSKYMSEYDWIFHMLNKSYTYIFIEAFKNYDNSKTKQNSNEKCFLLPLQEGLLTIFPGIRIPNQAKFVEYTNRNMFILIELINYMMRDYMFFKNSKNYIFVAITFRKIFRKIIGNNKIITYEILIALSWEVVSFIFKLVIEQIMDEFKDFPITTKYKAEDILNERELILIDGEVIHVLNQYEPVVIADFLENTFIKNIIDRNIRVTERQMYYYYINRNIVKHMTHEDSFIT